MLGNKKLSVMVLLLFMSITLGTFGSLSQAQVVWMDGGLIGDLMISGTNEYQELCFITGEPVLLKGTVKLPVIPTDKDTYTLKYTFLLIKRPLPRQLACIP